MRAAKRHMFEGEEMTVAQIKAIVPVISETAIREHLDAGRNTRTAMLSFSASAVTSRKSSKNAQRFNPTGLFARKGVKRK